MTTTRKWALLTLVAVIAVAAAGWFLLVSPKRSEAAELQTQTQSQLDANDQLRLKIATLKKQAEDIPEQKALLAQIKRQLPDNPALPSLVRDLTAIAKKGNVHLVSMAPGTATVMQLAAQPGAAPAPAPAPAAGSTGLKGSTVQPGQLFQIPLTLTVEGNYMDVQRFLGNAEQLERKMLITTFTLAPKGDAKAGAASAKHPKLTAAVSGQVYVSPTLGVIDPASLSKALAGATTTTTAPAAK